MLEKNNKKTINAWCMYDWANSTYALTITTAVFPPYFLWATGDEGGTVSLFGKEILNSAVYSYSLSIAYLLVAILNPFLSALADVAGRKKFFMKLFCYLGAASCATLYFFGPNTITLGIVSFMLAGVGFAGSQVFYNAYLPEIATEDRFDSVSAKGFSLGYIGSVILLIINLLLIQMPGTFGFELNEEGKTVIPGITAKISFLMVGIWWFGFAQITFKALPSNVYGRKVKENIIKRGITELKKVISQLQQLTNAKNFLISFFIYSMGVQTVMYIATIFGKDVVGLVMSELIILVLILQLVAIGGAYLFSLVSKKKGNIFSLCITLVIWIGVCITAFTLQKGMKTEFFVLGGFVGLIMGGVQSMSRSTYAKFIPQETEDHASFFSFYDTLEKTSIALGTFVYGLVLQLTGSQNNSALALTIFFVVGFVLLLRIPSKSVYNTTLQES